MDKVIHSDKNITAYGGLNLIFKAIKDKGLDTYIDQCLGFRGAGAKYCYSDVVLSLFGSALAQGSFVSDIEIFKEKYQDQFFTKIPSADTVEYVCQGLKTPTTQDITDKGVVHLVNYSNQMNETLVGLAVKTGLLKTGNDSYTLDFDNVVIENDKQDARYTYKKGVKGYHPNLGFIGRIPVHIENHNGNTPAAYEQKETLERCFENMRKAGVHISNFRADSASYQKEVITLAKKHVDHFYIRLDDCAGVRKQCGQVKEWTKVLINNVIKEVASIEYTPFASTGGVDVYRVVVTRTAKKDKQIDLLCGTAYNYYGIITNDKIKDDKDVIEFYNQRGDSENSNRYMLGDFNLHHLPFPDMCTNTVFMYLMAMCATLFEWIKVVLVDNKARGVTVIMRTKAICFHYITVASTFITHAREKVLKIFSTNEYKILQI
jgi:DDE family transposase